MCGGCEEHRALFRVSLSLSLSLSLFLSLGELGIRFWTALNRTLGFLSVIRRFIPNLDYQIILMGSSSRYLKSTEPPTCCSSTLLLHRRRFAHHSRAFDFFPIRGKQRRANFLPSRPICRLAFRESPSHASRESR